MCWGNHLTALLWLMMFRCQSEITFKTCGFWVFCHFEEIKWKHIYSVDGSFHEWNENIKFIRIVANGWFYGTQILQTHHAITISHSSVFCQNYITLLFVLFWLQYDFIGIISFIGHIWWFFLWKSRKIGKVFKTNLNFISKNSEIWK